jgi:AhpD family alkylhydroperoxidase
MEPRLDLLSNPLAGKALKRLHAAGQVPAESGLPRSTQELVKLRASQINGCGFCTDMHTKDALAAGESHERLHMVAAWREASVFTEAERAALALAEEGTRIADGSGVSDEVWLEAAKHYDEEQLTALVLVIAMINMYNRLNVLVRRPAGVYQVGMLD